MRKMINTMVVVVILVMVAMPFARKAVNEITIQKSMDLIEDQALLGDSYTQRTDNGIEIYNPDQNVTIKYGTNSDGLVRCTVIDEETGEIIIDDLMGIEE